MFSEETFQKLVRGLNRRELNIAEVWRAFAKLGGKESYNRLFALLDSPELGKWQIVNALDVLIQMRHLVDRERKPIADPEILFRKMLQLSLDPRILVRSVAIGLAVQFTTVPAINQHHKFQSATRENVEPIARKALEMGLVNPYALVVKEFLGVS